MADSNHRFATTQWTLVWKAAAADSKYARPALNQLVARYWLPLYSFARRQGLSTPDAEDATQEFLGNFVELKLLDHADPAKGRFRTFLLTAWKRFLIDQYRKEKAQRRHPTGQIQSIDFSSGERHWLQLPSRDTDPDRTFMRSWASSLLDEARQRLRAEYASRDKLGLYESLLPWLTDSPNETVYAKLAIENAASSSAMKVALHRMRSRFGSVLRAVVEETVDCPGDVDAELAEMLQALKD
jgi:RNA polymerase sigma factor (sigma-70 family)